MPGKIAIPAEAPAKPFGRDEHSRSNKPYRQDWLKVVPKRRHNFHTWESAILPQAPARFPLQIAPGAQSVAHPERRARATTACCRIQVGGTRPGGAGFQLRSRSQ